jgi:hypothetical protein
MDAARMTCPPSGKVSRAWLTPGQAIPHPPPRLEPGAHERGKCATRVVATFEPSHDPRLVYEGAILAKLPFAIEAKKLDLEAGDRVQHRTKEFLPRVEAPLGRVEADDGVIENRTKRRSVDEATPPPGVHYDIVPRRDARLLGVHRGRDIPVGAVENRQDLHSRGKMQELGVLPGQVPAQHVPPGVDQERKMADPKAILAMRDHRSERMCRGMRQKESAVFESKCVRHIHPRHNSATEHD